MIDLLNTELPASSGLKTLPNLIPTMAAPYRIAFVGGAPNSDDLDGEEVFVGYPGQLLNNLLNLSGLSRHACLLANLVGVPTEKRLIKGRTHSIGPHAQWDLESDNPLTQGIALLESDLRAFNPNLVVLLGPSALQWALGKAAKLDYLRGSLFYSKLGYKCLPTYHPSYVQENYDLLQVFALDLRRAAEEGRTKTFEIPERTLLVPDSPQEYLPVLLDYLQGILRDKPKVSIDIEGYVTNMTCLSIARSPRLSAIVPFAGHEGTSYWDEISEEQIWCLVSAILYDPKITKVYQNGLYDLFVKSHGYGLPIVGPFHDTMLKHWEAYCEMEKNLGFQASIYTRQPPWKDDRKNPDCKTHWRYCCMDSAVTYEIDDRLDRELDTKLAVAHSQFNHDMLNPVLYMELRGMKYHRAEAARRKGLVDNEIATLNDQMERLVGRPMNVNSPVFTKYLYEELNLPVIRHKQTKQPTANYEALLTLAKKTDLPVLHTAIRLRALRTHSTMLGIGADPDGRIRCGYSVVGSSTGRITCYTSPTGSGYNLQTIPEYDRDLFLADDDYYFFQCDLSGADGWTIAGHCARLGDSTMLDDLRAGVKIAKVVAAMFLHGPEVSRLGRADLLELTDRIPKKHPIYFGSKCGQHGTNYGMGAKLLSETIFVQSEGTVNISIQDAERIQQLYLMRYYGVRMYHNWCDQQLRDHGKCTAASGHTRIFNGRRKEHSTQTAFYSHEPQANTTYATNRAALNLWTDPQNRWGYWSQTTPIVEGTSTPHEDVLQEMSRTRHPDSLVIEPLHQVHDALCGQFPKAVVAWAAPRIKLYFENPLVIAGQNIVIPYEGGYGTSWGDTKVGKL